MKQFFASVAMLRMLVWKGGWRTLRAFIVTVYVGSNAVNWASLSPFERWVIVGGGIVAAGDALDAFLDQTFTRWQQGKALLPTGDTQPPFNIDQTKNTITKHA